MPISRINSPFNLSLPDTPYTKNKDVLPDIQALFNAIQQLQIAFTDYGGIVAQPSEYWSQLSAIQTAFPQNHNRFYPIFSENALAGSMINLWNDAGVLKARLANATNNTKPAHGYATAVVTSPANGEVILFNGLCTSIAGMTPGQRYWLHTTNGQIVNTAPVAAGNIEQAIGLALSTNILYFLTDLQFIQH